MGQNAFHKRFFARISSSTVEEKLQVLFLASLLGLFLFLLTHVSKAANYTFTQTDWDVGASAGTVAAHPGNQAGWTKYENPATLAASGITNNAIAARAGGELGLVTQNKIYYEAGTTTPSFTSTVSAVTASSSNAIAFAGGIKLARYPNWTTAPPATPGNFTTFANLAVMGSDPPRADTGSRLTLDPQGNPRVLYLDVDNNTYKYIFYLEYNGASWNTPLQLVQATGITGITMATDLNGVNHVVYHDTSAAVNKMRYMRCSINCTVFSNWSAPMDIDSSETVTAPNGYPAPSLTVDSNNVLHVAYGVSDAAIHNMVYRTCPGSTCGQGSSWSSAAVLVSTAFPSEVSQMTSIKVDSLNRPRVFILAEGEGSSGADATDGSPRLWWCNANCSNGANWYNAYIDSLGSQGSGSNAGFTFDQSNQLVIHVSYQQNAGDDVKYARCTIPLAGSGLVCTKIYLVQGSTSDGRFNAIGIDSERLFAVYSATGNNKLRLKTCTTNCTVGTNWLPDPGLDFYIGGIDDTTQIVTENGKYHHLHFRYQSDIQVMSPKYKGAGTFTSGVKSPESGIGVQWGVMRWDALDTPAGVMTVKARSSNDPTMAGATAFSACPALANNTDISGGCVTDGHAYIQYQVTFSTAVDSQSDILKSLRIGYSFVPTSAELTSSMYNSGDASNAVSSLGFDSFDASGNANALPGGTHIDFQARSGASQAALTAASFQGPDGTNGTWFQSNDPAACTYIAAPTPRYNCNLPASPFQSGDDDQWFQYKIRLVSSGGVTPSADNVRVTYVINNPPVISVTSSSQGADGVVTVNYDIGDQEESNTTVTVLYDVGITLSGAVNNTQNLIPLNGANAALLPSSGVIQIDNEQIEYSGKAGNTLTGAVRGIYDTSASALTTRAAAHSAGATVWFKATTVAGNQGSVNCPADPTPPVTTCPRSATWTAASDIPGVYSTTARMKIASNDGNLANQIASSNSAAFTLDTKDPVTTAPEIVIDSGVTKTNNAGGTVTLTLSAADDSPLEMMLSNNAAFTAATYEAYSASKTWTLTAGDGNKIVYVKFKDAKGNEVGPFQDGIILDRTAPQVPTGLSIQEVSNQSTGDVILFISWGVISTPIDPGGSNDFRRYNVYRSTSGGPYTLIGSTDEFNINDNSYTDIICNLSCIGTNYSYRVTAEDNIANVSANSDSVSATPTGTAPDITAPSFSGIFVGSPGINYLPITWTASESPASDKSDSAIAYSTPFTSDFSGSPTISDATFVSSGGTHLINVLGLTPGQVYWFEARSRDQSGNVGKATSTSGTPLEFTFPSIDTTAPSINSVTVTPTPKSAQFTWTTNEPASSVVEYGGKVYGDMRFSTTHTVVLPVILTAGTNYAYTVYARDIVGNESSAPGTFTTSALTDSIGPTISNIAEAPAQTTAVITWDTDEPTSSYVEFGTTVISGKPVYNRITGSRAFVTSHSVSLPQDLIPSTTYYYRVRSVDGSGNETISAGRNFDTLASPAPDTTPPNISSVTVTGAGVSSMLVEWTTSEPTNAIVEYSENSTSYNLSRKVTKLGTTHSVEIAGLKPKTLYKFRVKSEDPSGNSTINDNGGIGYTFATLAAGSPADLVISNVEFTAVGQTTTITWTTSEAAVGFVEYGFDTGYGEVVASSLTPATSHSVTLPTDTLGDVIYNFQIRARTADNRQTISREVAVFTTPPSPATTVANDTTPPVISSINVTLVTHNAAVISWITDEGASTEADYGITTLFGTVASTTPGLLSQSHSITLTGLTQGTTYYFRVMARDANGNLATVSTGPGGTDLKFTTQTLATSAPPPATDSTAPSISSVEVKDIKSQEATVTWGTNEQGNSLIEFDKKSGGPYADLAGDTSNFVTEHSVTMTGLSASTTYYFVATSFDRSGNKGSSAEFSFTTTGFAEDEALEALKKKLEIEAEESQLDLINKLLGLSTSTQELVNNFLSELGLLPDDERAQVLEILFGQITGPARVIDDIPTIEVTDSSATITWETTRDTTSAVAFAADARYKPGDKNPYSASSGDSQTYGREHKVTLVDLDPGTVYHYQLQGEERNGKQALSVDRTFRTLPRRPAFTGVRVQSTGEETAVVSWSTSIPAEGVIEFTNTVTNEKKSQGDPQVKRSHEVMLIGLSPRTQYRAVITAKTEDDVIVRSQPFTFKTGEDNKPPEILEVSTKLSLAAGKTDSAQAVITWTTNEVSDSQVFYDEGVSTSETFKQSSPLQKDLTTSHIVVLSKLRPGTIYRFKAVSRDAAGNDGSSKEFKIITPKKDQSVLELIIQNFEDTFGFLKQGE